MVTLFTESDLKVIEETIRRVETHTSGEIVLLVRPSSDPYTLINWAVATAGWALASSLFLLCASWHLSVYALLGWQLVATLSFWFIADIPRVKRSLLSAQMVRYRVHREAMANFLIRGLHHTKEHTGILIYISELEHQVEIVADKGIHTKVGDAYWLARVADIAGSIRAGKSREGLVATIELIGVELAKHFPPGSDNPNELPNRM